MFDYGTQGNIQHYNQPTAPQYQFNNFPKTLPTVFFTGGEDYLGNSVFPVRHILTYSRPNRRCHFARIDSSSLCSQRT